MDRAERIASVNSQKVRAPKTQRSAIMAKVYIGLLLCLGLSVSGVALLNPFQSPTPAVSAGPAGIVIDSAVHHAFVFGAATGNVAVLDTRTQKTVATYQGDGSDDVWIGVDQHAHRALIAQERTSTVLLVRTDTLAVVRRMTIAYNPSTGAIDDSLHRAYIAHMAPTGVAIINLLTGQRVGDAPTLGRVGTIGVNTTVHRVCVGGSATPRLTWLDGYTGHRLSLQVLRTPSFDIAAIAAANHTKRFFAIAGGHVYTFDALTRQLVAIVSVPGASALGVDERQGHVFVVNQFAGTIVMLNARSGKVIALAAVQSLPFALAIDAVHQRLYVVNNGSSSVSILNTRTGLLVRTVVIPAHAVDVDVDTIKGAVFVVTDGLTPQPNDGSLWTKLGVALQRISHISPRATARRVQVESI